MNVQIHRDAGDGRSGDFIERAERNEARDARLVLAAILALFVTIVNGRKVIFHSFDQDSSKR